MFQVRVTGEEPKANSKFLKRVPSLPQRSQVNWDSDNRPPAAQDSSDAVKHLQDITAPVGKPPLRSLTKNHTEYRTDIVRVRDITASLADDPALQSSHAMLAGQAHAFHRPASSDDNQ